MASRCGGANRGGTVGGRDSAWRRANRHCYRVRDARENLQQFSLVHGARDGRGGGGFPSGESGARKNKERRARASTRDGIDRGRKAAKCGEEGRAPAYMVRRWDRR